MTEFITWNKDRNIAYIVGLLMFEHINLLHHQYEGYDVHVETRNNIEYWTITMHDESLVLRFNSAVTYSSRIKQFDKALKELKEGIRRKDASPTIQKTLFVTLSREAIKYRQRIRLRWGDLTVTVKPSGENLKWFIRYKNDTVNYVSVPSDDEAAHVFTEFLRLVEK